ncbi:MAG: hypothetical protein AAGM22_25010 [Acidobacteriota bacterium]
MEAVAFSHKVFLAFTYLYLSCLLPASTLSALDFGGMEIAPLPSITVNSATEGFKRGLDRALAANDMTIFLTSSTTACARRWAMAGSLESGHRSEWPAAVQ